MNATIPYKNCNNAMSKVYSLKTVQNIPVSLEKAWDFFSNPSNLAAITPAHMNFEIISQHHGEQMYPGQIIEYKVSLLPVYRVYWMTEITHVEDKTFFIDEQRFGPYSLWHHQHHFKEINGGVEMTDIVHYKIPFWFLGDIANQLFVKRELKKIFEYRFSSVEQLFGKWKG
jgi:ligand-binding SRPBCC domain-containing protein